MTRAFLELRSAVRPHFEKISAGDNVLVAVSGGADSLALAAAVLAESKEFLVNAIAVTIDHQLQTGSGEQAAKVSQQLKELGYVDVVLEKVSVDQSSGI